MTDRIYEIPEFTSIRDLSYSGVWPGRVETKVYSPTTITGDDIVSVIIHNAYGNLEVRLKYGGLDVLETDNGEDIVNAKRVSLLRVNALNADDYDEDTSVSESGITPIYPEWAQAIIDGEMFAQVKGDENAGAYSFTRQPTPLGTLDVYTYESNLYSGRMKTQLSEKDIVSYTMTGLFQVPGEGFNGEDSVTLTCVSSSFELFTNARNIVIPDDNGEDIFIHRFHGTNGNNPGLLNGQLYNNAISYYGVGPAKDSLVSVVAERDETGTYRLDLESLVLTENAQTLLDYQMDISNVAIYGFENGESDNFFIDGGDISGYFTIVIEGVNTTTADGKELSHISDNGTMFYGDDVDSDNPPAPFLKSTIAKVREYLAEQTSTGNIVSTTEPTPRGVGDGWFNPETKELKIWVGE